MDDLGDTRVFGLPPGADFPAELVRGLRARLDGQPPEAMARVQLFLSTERMRRRVRMQFTQSGAAFLPRLRLLTELDPEAALLGLSRPVSPLRRRLELSRLVRGLLDAQPDLAPRAAVFDLADSLARLMDEMQGEGVSPDAIAVLDVSNHSAHWARVQQFMQILRPFFSADEATDQQARLRQVVDGLERAWQTLDPADPVIIAGSTGSRGTTLRMMQKVLARQKGVVVLPGFDFDMPLPVWAGLGDALTSEDHPQYRFRQLFEVMDLSPEDVRPWTDRAAPNGPRNRLVSLSLRPAPVTDQWLTEGVALTDLDVATAGLTLIEADSPRDEALALALILREAAEHGLRTALITPDRGLTRRVEAALDRWGIRPDDSAGKPLPLTPPGRLMRHVASLFGQKLTSEALLVILKHPLTASDSERGQHLLLTRELELWLRRSGPPFPTAPVLQGWATAGNLPECEAWVDWIITTIGGLEHQGEASLKTRLQHHLGITEALARGPWGQGSGALWTGIAGEAARATVDELLAEAEAGGDLLPFDYRALFDAVLGRGEVREDRMVHPQIMFWGTLEARVGGADLVVLGGLNDGVWPQSPPPDPWLNRRMRLEAGLSLPERQIGLSAHDYQQAIAAPRVILSRARRDSDAETVPSRWLNRLTNLLGGLPDKGGPEALDAMRGRGNQWLELANRLERPDAALPAAGRSSPRPPVAHRPRELALTRIATLIRNPYEIYARYILRLRKLDPLHRGPDARLRGSTLHKILETFVRARSGIASGTEKERLLAIADEVLQQEVSWPAARMLWRARLERAADFFLSVDGADGGIPVSLEEAGRLRLADLDFSLWGIPDRIDLLPDGRLHIIDYKTGTPPTSEQQSKFDKQLLLAACMAERGGFDPLGPTEVARISYIGLGSQPKVVTTPITAEITAETWDSLHRLIARYMQPQTGYTARRAMFETNFPGDYDHLSRFGEWEMTDPAQPCRTGTAGEPNA